MYDTIKFEDDMSLSYQSPDLKQLFFYTYSQFVVNIQIQYEIFICVEGGISDPNIEAR